MTLIEQGKLSTAVAIVQRLAECYYQGAATALARIYESGGDSVEIDLTAARHWYEIAIHEESCLEAKLGLARVLIKSSELEDQTQGVSLLESLMEPGNHQAHLILATVLEAGVGVPKDVGRAKQLYVSAARNGYIFAMIRLASIARDESRYLDWAVLRLRAAGFTIRVLLANRGDDERLWYIK